MVVLYKIGSHNKAFKKISLSKKITLHDLAGKFASVEKQKKLSIIFWCKKRLSKEAIKAEEIKKVLKCIFYGKMY